MQVEPYGRWFPYAATAPDERDDDEDEERKREPNRRTGAGRGQEHDIAPDGRLVVFKRGTSTSKTVTPPRIVYARTNGIAPPTSVPTGDE